MASAWPRSVAAARTMRHNTDNDICTARCSRLLLLLICGRVNERLCIAVNSRLRQLTHAAVLGINCCGEVNAAIKCVLYRSV